MLGVPVDSDAGLFFQMNKTMLISPLPCVAVFPVRAIFLLTAIDILWHNNSVFELLRLGRRLWRGSLGAAGNGRTFRI